MVEGGWLVMLMMREAWTGVCGVVVVGGSRLAVRMRGSALWRSPLRVALPCGIAESSLSLPSGLS